MRVTEKTQLIARVVNKKEGEEDTNMLVDLLMYDCVKYSGSTHEQLTVWDGQHGIFVPDYFNDETHAPETKEEKEVAKCAIDSYIAHINSLPEGEEEVKRIVVVDKFTLKRGSAYKGMFK
jgi:hypothetical protein